jgi:CBS-domain-containing membrane protein
MTRHLPIDPKGRPMARRLHVLVRHLHSGDKKQTQLNIHCPEKRRCIDLLVCAECPRCDEVPANTTGPESLLTCRPRVPEHPGQAPGPLDHPRVEEIMVREVDCVTRDLLVDDLVPILSRRPGAVFVVDEECRPIGVVSDADVEGAALARDGSEVPGTTALTVDDIMEPIEFSLSPITPIAKVAALLAFAHRPLLPVVGSSGELIGVLSAQEVKRWTAAAAPQTVAGG